MAKIQIQESMWFKEQHEYVMDFFSLEKNAFTMGKKELFGEDTAVQFRNKALMTLVMLFFFKFLFDIRVPGIVDVIGMLIGFVLMIEALIRFSHSFNDSTKKEGVTAITKYLALLLIFIIVWGYVS